MEDLRHFILDCRCLEKERMEVAELQRPRVEDDDEVLGCFLFGREGEQEKKRALCHMWRRREREMRREEKKLVER